MRACFGGEVRTLVEDLEAAGGEAVVDKHHLGRFVLARELHRVLVPAEELLVHLQVMQ